MSITALKKTAIPAWMLFLATGLVVTALFVAMGGHPTTQALLYIGFSLTQSAVVVVSVARRRPTCRLAWRALASGVVLSSIANVVWYGSPALLHRPLPFPSLVDAVFFASYALELVGLVLLIRSRALRSDRAGALIDSAIVTVAAAALSWIYLLGPTASLSASSPGDRLVALMYPLFDLALLALALRLVLTRGPRTTAFWLLTAFVTLQLAADATYSLSLLQGTFAHGQPFTVGWLISWACLGSAALHPSMRTLGRPAMTADEPAFPMVRVVLVGCSGLLVPALSIIEKHRASESVVVGSAALLFILATVRMVVFVRDLQVKSTALRATVQRLNESEDDLAYQANHDALTGLPNRAYFMRRLERAVERGSRVTVMLLDLDGFKTVNDSLGHAGGDAMLTAVANRLCGGLRESDVVARLGGDEFTVLADGLDGRAAVDLAERLVSALDAPIFIGGRHVFCRVSIGIALRSDCTSSAADLLRDADAAMYAAKRKGGQRFEVFTADMHARALDRLALETDLRDVDLGKDMALHYQPLVDLADGGIVGFEALLRWHHAERGVVSPCDFIPIAEEIGAIVPIGRWVIEEACRQLTEWHVRFPRPVPLGVNVNVSARQLADPGIVDDVARALADTGLAPSLLTLEITETMMLADEDDVRDCLVRLKALGVRISVDDFGTGYSSLGHLDRFPVDELKIDRSFVAKLGAPSAGSGVAAAAVRLARDLQIDVVAEGIETEEQLVELRRLACGVGQGYYFAKPLEPAAAEVLLAGAATTTMPATPDPVALVVDDDDSVRESTCRILRACGFNTISVASGGDALATAATTAIDVVVLDVGLPDMDGYEVCDRLSHGVRAAVPVVYLSGSAVEAGDRARGLDAGADHYLIKPVDPNELVAAVRAVLRSRESGLTGADSAQARARGLATAGAAS